MAALGMTGCTREAHDPASTATSTDAGVTVADLIIAGGPIVTMDAVRGKPEAVAIRDGKILAVGSKNDIEALRGKKTEQVDLEGRTLLPGFIDGHSHFSMAVKSATWANVSGAPVGNVASIADILAELKAQAKRNRAVPGDWIIGYGYDQDTLSEGRHATRDDLDAAFPDNPVIMIHVSFHGAVLNSKAFETIQYDESTPTPEGGVIVRRDGGIANGRRAFVRALVLPVSVAILALGLIGMVLGRERRTLHDVAAGTVMIYDWGARQAEQPVTIREQLSARVRRRKKVDGVQADPG